jgi:hypothetical protein
VKAEAIDIMSLISNRRMVGRAKGLEGLFLAFWAMTFSITIELEVLTIKEANSLTIDGLKTWTESNSKCEVLDMAYVSIPTISTHRNSNDLASCIGLRKLLSPSKRASATLFVSLIDIATDLMMTIMSGAIARPAVIAEINAIAYSY